MAFRDKILLKIPEKCFCDEHFPNAIQKWFSGWFLCRSDGLSACR